MLREGSSNQYKVVTELACQVVVAADGARMEAQEVKASLKKLKIGKKSKKPMGPQARYLAVGLQAQRDELVQHWVAATKGLLSGSACHFTIRGDEGLESNIKQLFDGLMAMLHSTHKQPNTTKLQELWASLLLDEHADDLEVLRQSMRVIHAAEAILRPAAIEILQRCSSEDAADTLLRGILHQASTQMTAMWNRRFDPSRQVTLLVEAQEKLVEARDTVLKALEACRALVPECPRITSAHTVEEGLAQSLKTAAQLRALATRLSLTVPQEGQPPMTPTDVHDQVQQRLRVALVQVLRDKVNLVSYRWTRAINEQIPAYAEFPCDVTQNTLATSAMIERLSPHGECASLVYVCQAIVALRYPQMAQESVQHAFQLFEQVALQTLREELQDLAREPLQSSPESLTLMPLLYAGEGPLRTMIAEVCWLASEFVTKEYLMRRTAGLDPRPPDELFKVPNHPFERERIPEVFLGAKIMEQFVVDAYIFSGGFGRGWRAQDTFNGQKNVFVKTFKSAKDKDWERKMSAEEHDAFKRAVVQEMEACERVMKISRLMEHTNVVKVIMVARGTVDVPLSRLCLQHFNAIVTEYCPGGELTNYLTVGHQIKNFTERQARFFFCQILEILKLLHCAEDPRDRYYHGDLKEQNLVLDGTTLKLIDYGSLQQVSTITSKVTHHTKGYYDTPYHNTPEAVDLWACGVILFNLVALENTGALDYVHQHLGDIQVFTTGIFLSSKGRGGGGKPESPEVEARRFRPWPLNHPMRRSGPDSLRDLLGKILTVNRIQISAIENHPWLRETEVSPEDMRAEMHQELVKRYRGIEAEVPPGTVFYLIPLSVKKEAAFRYMEAVVGQACAAPEARMRYRVKEKRENVLIVQCSEPSTERHTPGEGWDRGDGLWQTSTFSCDVVAPHAEYGHHNRIRVHWETGTLHTDFFQWSSLLASAVTETDSNAK